MCKSVVRTIHTKGAQKKKQNSPNVQIVLGHMLPLTKGVQSIKSRQHVVNHQKSYAAVVSQNSHSQPKNTQTFQFTAEQLTKFVANVAIQIAQPQVCYPNPKQDMLDLKSSMCRKVSNVAKTILGVNVTGKELLNQSAHLVPLLPQALYLYEHQGELRLQNHLKTIHI